MRERDREIETVYCLIESCDSSATQKYAGSYASLSDHNRLSRQYHSRSNDLSFFASDLARRSSISFIYRMYAEGKECSKEAS